MTESNAQFLARMKATPSDKWSQRDTERILNWAEERVMIEEHNLQILPNLYGRWWTVKSLDEQLCIAFCESNPDPSTAIRSVVAKIGECNDH